MNDFNRIARVTSAFAHHQERGTFCTASADVLGVASAGVSLMSARHNAPVCHSDERSPALDETQFPLGEGPSLDAFAPGEAIHEPDLEHPPGSTMARLRSDRFWSSAPARSSRRHLTQTATHLVEELPATGPSRHHRTEM